MATGSRGPWDYELRAQEASSSPGKAGLMGTLVPVRSSRKEAVLLFPRGRYFLVATRLLRQQTRSHLQGQNFLNYRNHSTP